VGDMPGIMGDGLMLWCVIVGLPRIRESGGSRGWCPEPWL
jgi:hypothetical protein